MPKPEHLLPPSILAAAEMAWERAQRNRPPDSDAPRSLGATSLLGTLDAGVRAAKEAGRTGFVRLESIANPEIARAFYDSLTETSKLFARVGIVVPSFEEMVAGSDNGQGERINLEKLAGFYEEMKAESQMPEIAITPQGLPFETWRQIYDNMTPERDENGKITKNAPGMPKNNPLWRSGGLGGLNIDKNVQANLHQFNLPTVLRADGTQLPTYIDTNNHHWTVRLIPGTPRPTLVNISYQQHKANGGVHPTIAELLTVHGQWLQRGTKLPDDFIEIWAEGEFTGERDVYYAPIVYWSDVCKQVYIDKYNSTTPGQFLGVGVRPPMG